MYTDINEIMKANKLFSQNEGRAYWFGANEMKFFRTKVEDLVIDGKFFFTREQEPGGGKMAWTVRECRPTGEIRTVGNFHSHKTLNAAKKFLHRLRTKGEGV